MTDRREKGARGKSPWAGSLARVKRGEVPADGSLSPQGSSVRRDPLHGVTLKMIVTRLEAHYGWQELGRRIPVNCFLHEPSLASSLKFLRRTPWAREKVEAVYRQTPLLHGEPRE